MSPAIFIAGMITGVFLAAPVGPLALICIHRSVTRGSLHGFVSGLGIATADAVYAGIAASGLALAAGVLLPYQLPLRIIAGIALLVIGYRVFSSPAEDPSALRNGDAPYLHEFIGMTALTLANVFTIISIGIFLSGSGIVISTASPVAGIFFAGGVFVGELIWWLLVCFGLGSINNHINPAHYTAINRISGGFISIAGIMLLLSAAFR